MVTGYCLERETPTTPTPQLFPRILACGFRPPEAGYTLRQATCNCLSCGEVGDSSRKGRPSVLLPPCIIHLLSQADFSSSFHAVVRGLSLSLGSRFVTMIRLGRASSYGMCQLGAGLTVPNMKSTPCPSYKSTDMAAEGGSLDHGQNSGCRDDPGLSNSGTAIYRRCGGGLAAAAGLHKLSSCSYWRADHVQTSTLPLT
jgi:hypothetical protein